MKHKLVPKIKGLPDLITARLSDGRRVVVGHHKPLFVGSEEEAFDVLLHCRNLTCTTMSITKLQEVGESALLEPAREMITCPQEGCEKTFKSIPGMKAHVRGKHREFIWNEDGTAEQVPEAKEGECERIIMSFNLSQRKERTNQSKPLSDAGGP